MISTTWRWSFSVRMFRVTVRDSWSSPISFRFCLVSWEKASHIFPYSSVDTVKGLKATRETTVSNRSSLQPYSVKKRRKYFTWWSWIEAVCMRTALTEGFRQAAGKKLSQPLPCGPKASSQSENTDTLLPCDFLPPALHCHTRRIPEINITRKCPLMWLIKRA